MAFNAEQKRVWRQQNREKIAAYRKRWQNDPEFREQIVSRQKEALKKAVERKAALEIRLSRILVLVCPRCESEFTSKQPHQIYCSRQCYRRRYEQNRKQKQKALHSLVKLSFALNEKLHANTT